MDCFPITWNISGSFWLGNDPRFKNQNFDVKSMFLNSHTYNFHMSKSQHLEKMKKNNRIPSLLSPPGGFIVWFEFSQVSDWGGRGESPCYNFVLGTMSHGVAPQGNPLPSRDSYPTSAQNPRGPGTLIVDRSSPGLSPGRDRSWAYEEWTRPELCSKSKKSLPSTP